MAKYLRTSSITAEVEQLIRESRERLYIISPYLKLSDNVRELFKDKDREKVEVIIIYGKEELNPTEISFFQNLNHFKLYFSKNLHAKCYLNEKKMIIGSMNLYEFSQQYNKEMGVLIDRNNEHDRQIYEDAWDDIISIRNNASDFPYMKVLKKNGQPKIEQFTKIPQSKPSGFCIRTGIPIQFNPEKPLSNDAYRSWNQFGDPNYPEKYCHFSGEASKGDTSFNKPILGKNWKKAKEAFGF